MTIEYEQAKLVLAIDYNEIDLQELDRLYFLHGNNFSLICDGDTKQVIIIKEEI